MDNLDGKLIESEQPVDFHPPLCWRDPENAGQFKVKCFVDFDHRIFSASYTVAWDGRVEMDEDEELGVLHAANSGCCMPRNEA